MATSGLSSWIHNISCLPFFHHKDHKSAILGTSRSSRAPCPKYNKQNEENCIIHVSLENGNRNRYKSIAVTNQDRAPFVIQRAMSENNLQGLVLILSKDRELVIPDDGNIYYAVGPSANFDFTLEEVEDRI